jgi:iron complex transport system ATP-binding protein
MFHVEQLSVRRGTRTLLDDLTFSLTPGQWVGVIGPNGAGKSTQLRVLSGNQKPSSGTVHLKEKPLAAYPTQVLAQHLAFVPQETPMTFPFHVAELVGMGARSKEAQEKAVDVMELGELLVRPVTALSGGERQRAALARGLAQETPILLLDEPTAHLDLRYQERLLVHLQDLVRERGVLVVVALHDLLLAREFADSLLLLDKGRLVALGTPTEVLTEANLRAVYGISPERIAGILKTSGNS